MIRLAAPRPSPRPSPRRQGEGGRQWIPSPRLRGEGGARVSGRVRGRFGRDPPYLGISLLALLAALALAACGRKGPPEPPPDVPNTFPRPYPSE